MYDQLDLDGAAVAAQQERRRDQAVSSFVVRFGALIISEIALLYVVFARPIGISIGLRLMIAVALLLFVIGLLATLRAKARRYLRQEQWEAVIHRLIYGTTSGMSDEEATFSLNRWPSEHILARLTIALVMMVLLYIPVGIGSLLLVRLIWPGVPAWLSVAVVLAAVFVAWPWLRRRKEAKLPESAQNVGNELKFNALLLLVFVSGWGILRVLDQVVQVIFGSRLVFGVGMLILVPIVVLLLEPVVQLLVRLWKGRG